MQILPADTNGITSALKILQAGGVIAHATETCYGFACDLSNPAAVKKLFLIKDRPFHQPVSALFSSIDKAKKYVTWNERAQELAEKHLPGPLTLILLLQADAPTTLYTTPTNQRVNESANPRTVGIRISSHPLAQQLATEFTRPISTTSANLHGRPNPYSVMEIEEQFRNEIHQPDLILDSGILPHTPPSTVVDASCGANWKTLRGGSISVAQTR